jgi:predicted DNA-binding transcriptional regulator YafY
LSSIGTSLTTGKIEATMEKMKSLLPARDEEGFNERHSKLIVDFSMLGAAGRHQDVLRIVERAVDRQQLLKMTYTNTRLENTERVVEPMTIAFKWRSWYLFGFCRKKNDYRLFRLSRIKNPQILEKRFRRREKNIDEYFGENGGWDTGKTIDLILAFQASMRPLVEEYFTGPDAKTDVSTDDDGRLIVRTSMPEDGWVYGMILSYGNLVEVLSPPHARAVIRKMAADIQSIYE